MLTSSGPRAFWRLSNPACRNPRRTSRKSAAEGTWLLKICLRRANASREWWRRATPTNTLLADARSSMPASDQLPPHFSYSSSTESFLGDDTAQLRKTVRWLLRPIEPPRPTVRDRLRVDRDPHTQRRYGPDKECDGSVQSWIRLLRWRFA